jgi:hypothetical protein
MAKRFFVCAGILCLVFAYHLGATNATAQAVSRLDQVDRDGGHMSGSSPMTTTSTASTRTS